MIKKMSIFIVAFVISETAEAGAYALTHHARANGGNNEAIACEEALSSPFPNAKNGINIMPAAEIALMLPKAVPMMNPGIEGYSETTATDESVDSLFKVERSAKDEIKQFDNDNNPLDTHLKSSLSKIKLSFRFDGVPSVENESVIGYAAAGGYTHNKGWDGVVEFFSSPRLGTCSFTTYEIQKAILAEETTEYVVNNKPSSASVSGNWGVGFLYVVTWFTNHRIMIVECANKKYDSRILQGALGLANRIDRQM